MDYHTPSNSIRLSVTDDRKRQPKIHKLCSHSNATDFVCLMDRGCSQQALIEGRYVQIDSQRKVHIIKK